MSFDKVNKNVAPVEEKEVKQVARSVTAEQRRSNKKEPIGYVKGVQNLNVRARPSSKADILTTLPMGTAVTVKGSTEEYYQIVTPDLTEGYVVKGFLDVRR